MAQPDLNAAADDLRAVYTGWEVFVCEGHLILAAQRPTVHVSVLVCPTVHGCEGVVTVTPCEDGNPVDAGTITVRSTWEGSEDGYGLWLAALVEAGVAAVTVAALEALAAS
jgi:hypothetical protein